MSDLTVSNEVIEQFLVSIGYKENTASREKAKAGVVDFEKAIMSLGKTIAATAIAVTYGVTKFADNLEQLYFASIRTRTSATNIKEAQLAFQNLGVSATESLGAMESLAINQRKNPAFKGWLESLGVHAKDTKGQLTELAAHFRDLDKEGAGYLAYQYGERMGLTDKTVMAMMNPDFDKEMTHAEGKVKDAQFDSASANAHKLMEDVRDTLMDVQKLANTTFNEHFKEFDDTLQHAVKTLEDIAGWLDKIFGWLGKIDGLTNGWSTTLLTIWGTLGLISAAGLGKVFTSLASIVGLDTGAGLLAAGIGLVVAQVALLGATGLAAYTSTKALVDLLPQKKQDALIEHVGGTIAHVMAAFGDKDAQDAIDSHDKYLKAHPEDKQPTFLEKFENEISRQDPLTARKEWIARGGKAEDEPPEVATATQQAPKAVAAAAVKTAYKKLAESVEAQTPIGNTPAAIVQRYTELVNYFSTHGFTKDQAIGMAATLHGESAEYDPQAVGDKATINGKDQYTATGIAQWHAARDADFKKIYGHSLATASLKEQESFIVYELDKGKERKAGAEIHAAMSAEDASFAMTHDYERPRDKEDEAYSRAGYATVLKNADANAQQITAAPPLVTPAAASTMSNAAGASAAAVTIGKTPTVTNNNDVKITVNGSQDPKAVATEVKRQIDMAVSNATHSFAYQGT